MGGRAFIQALPVGSFPRLRSPLYNDVKKRLTEMLQTIYEYVEVPPEAPEKKDHGDVDFVVACHPGGAPTTDRVKDVLGAVAAVQLEGYKMSNYAVPLTEDELQYYDDEIMPHHDENESAKPVYVQVDVHVCENREQAESLVIFKGYGDLSMIVFNLAHQCGLKVSSKGTQVTPDIS